MGDQAGAGDATGPDDASADGAAEVGGTTIGELWRWATAELDDRTVARWMCEVATGCDAAELTAARRDPASARPVTDRMVTDLAAMLARYRAGEPLQYVLGRWSFRRLDLAVDRRVLIPRPETEEVAGVAVELTAAAVRTAGTATVADLGTGSGAIGLAVASESRLDAVTVWMTDRDLDALDVARANLAGLGRRGARVRLAAGSWYAALPADQHFDVIVSNPPYVAVGSPDVEAAVQEWEPGSALFAGLDGLDDLRVIVAGAPAHLVSGGWLVLEIGADQGAAVRQLLSAAGLVDVEIRPDAAGRDRIAVARTATGPGRGPRATIR